MRTYKLTIAYDGTRYQGWQRQANTDRTIQGILEKIISEAAQYPVEVNGSGRTDAGVHASGQTASVVLPGAVEEGFFTDYVNGKLPHDIRICKANLMKNGFHARKSAAWNFPCEPDLEAMRKAAGYLKGTHDFAGYTDKKIIPDGKGNKADEKSTNRTIYDIIVSGQGSSVTIRYEGTGFLYHMVRILTGTLLEAGTHQRTAESVMEALRTKDRGQAGFLAPARGLFLKEVHYDRRGR